MDGSKSIMEQIRNINNVWSLLMDLDDPSILLARTLDPIMVPQANYEISGFFGYVVFTNGHIVERDKLTIYYGAADEFVCGVYFLIQEILSVLRC
ncbi:glycoside hydrolase family 130 protein [Flavobacterium geliluteum]|uniref:glycoside hydrolase family 130 protein n=1 Tax=Flavobacterium geliluteum TaxID=2816120 RepID=UPI0021D41D31|nr:hypothetical protein [Flavobacterium geliluteum]